MTVINQNMPLAPRDTAWSAAEADKRVRAFAGAEEKPNEKYSHAFFYKEGDGTNFGDYKLPHADVIDGKLMAVPKAIFAVAAVLDGGRGGLDIPDADKEKIKGAVEKYYAKMREEFKDETLKAPWDKKDKAEDVPGQRAEEAPVAAAHDGGSTMPASADSARAEPGTAIRFKKTDDEIVYRDAEFDLRTLDQDKRTVDLSFSSETPVDRFYGMEILDHSQDSVNLKRLNGGAPLLLNHDPDQHIGVVEKASVGSDKKGRATVRFGRSQLASDAFQDVQDGIRRGVSVGYRTHDDPVPEDVAGQKGYRFKNWEPLEISLASVPADASVGVGRTLKKPITQGDPDMGTETTTLDPAAERAAAIAAERERVKLITDAAAKLVTLAPNVRGLADKCIREGTSAQEFTAQAFAELETAGHATRAPSADIGLTDKEAQDFSLVRMIQYLHNPKDQKLRDAAAFEIEASTAAKLRYKSDRGDMSFCVPFDVMRAKRLARLEAQRDLSYSGGTTQIVATNLLAADFIDILRNATKVKQMGATVLGGLVGNVAIPRQSGAATAYWVSTDTTALTESDQTFDQVSLSVHNVTGYTKFSRQLLLQSTPDIEGIVRSDLVRILAIAVDLAAINGSGSSGQPTGVLNTSGINSVALGTNGAAPTWVAVADMVGKLIQSNAYFGRLGWLTNGQVWETLVTTAKIGSTYPTFILDDDADELFKAPFEVSQQVPANLTKGTGTSLSALIFANWADLIIGEWGGLDILVDPYTAAASQETAIYVYQSVDIKTRHPLSFCAITDMITT